MTPMRLFLSDGAPAKNWACGKCRIVKLSRQEAEECCRPWTCKTCGDEVSTYRTMCPGCRRAQFERREQNIWENAQPVEDCELWTCNGEFFDDDVQYVEDALAEGTSVPRVYATRPAFPRIDARDLIESLMDEMDSEYHMSWSAEEKELQEFLDAWCEKHRSTFTIHFEDTSRKSAYAAEKDEASRS